MIFIRLIEFCPIFTQSEPSSQNINIEWRKNIRHVLLVYFIFVVFIFYSVMVYFVSFYPFRILLSSETYFGPNHDMFIFPGFYTEMVARLASISDYPPAFDYDVLCPWILTLSHWYIYRRKQFDFLVTGIILYLTIKIRLNFAQPLKIPVSHSITTPQLI